MKKVFSLFFGMVVLFGSYAQEVNIKCGEAYVEQTLADYFGSYEEIRNAYLNEVAKYPDAGHATENVYIVPVVVHVIYDTPENNITRAQVLDAIRVLNRDYRRMNVDTANTRAIFKPVAADIQIEFQLAKKDPGGNCTDGITRTFSSLTNGAFNNVKPLSNWDNTKYLNIWVVESINSSSTPGTILGYAYKPVPGGQPFTLDGIVIRNDQMGTIGTARAGGRTLVHEAGHYFGLDHPFRNGCFSGDGCSDTPPVASSNSGCNMNANSCSNDVPDLPDQVENYMDYADDNCTNMFTLCQRGKMRATLASSNLRANLVSNNNALATGISPNMVLPCPPEPDFNADKRLICEGESIQFTDMTYLGNPTSMQWTFAGGNPATSTLENPIVTYSQKGSYEVELVTSNASGTATKTYKGYVSVRSQTNTPYINIFGDDFEAYPIPNENWHVTPGLDTMHFRYFNKTAFAGQSCVTLQNFGAFEGERDAMISHAISLENSTSAQLTFNYAFAERSFGNTDRLRVYISTDCGETWTLENNQQGPLLRTTNTRIDTAWWPTMAAEWKEAQVDLNDYAPSPDYILIKFEFENGGGNNLYIDEPRISATIGNKEELTAANITVYPNPASAELHIDLGSDETAGITVLDVTGRTVLHKNTNGQRVISLETAHLNAGLYIIQVEINGQKSNHKVVIE
jgi:PKD repeat protein